jgi:magnesium chelatase family protein
MLAKALAGILPDLEVDAATEVTSLYSVAGLLQGPGLVRRPPLRSPHHSITVAGFLGGGRVFQPGEVSLSHHGVLVLDELPEFHRDCLEALRQPLEEGALRLRRASGIRNLPARFTLAATANPCPCGAGPVIRRGVPAAAAACACPPDVVERYQRRVSGPLRDRIDLIVAVAAVELVSLSGDSPGPSSEAVRSRVAAARRAQAARQGSVLNAALPARELPALCGLTPAAERTVPRLSATHRLSGRGFHGSLRVARTIADLAGSWLIDDTHLAEACEYRAA